MIRGTVRGRLLDLNAGGLTSIPGSPFLDDYHLESVAVDSFGRFAYVVSNGFGHLSGYRINPNTGALIPVAGSPWLTGLNPGLNPLSLAVVGEIRLF